MGFLTLSACATSRVLPEDSSEAIHQIEQEIVSDEAAMEGVPFPNKRPRIPLEVNKKVLKWIRYFTVQDRDRFERFLERGTAYRALVQDILRKNGVPPELYYLAMIESGYVVNARSRANAVGAWQFIRSTGLHYGLAQTALVDERRDIVRSTEAAARYIRTLREHLHSWYLAIAAYNAGESRIRRAIRHARSRDFWALVESHVLPPETRNYVPKFLAAMIIGKHPARYGFDVDPAEPSGLFAASVPGGVRLVDVASATGVSLERLREMNPHLLRGIVPPGRSYELWVPEQAVPRVLEAGATLAQAAQAHPIPAVWRVGHRYRKHHQGRRHHVRRHRVRRGESLTLISERYQIPVKRIRHFNHLHSNRIYVGQKLLIPSGI